MRDQLAMFGLPAVEPAEHPEARIALGRSLPAQVYLGTSSWSFPGWTDRVWKRSPSESLLASDGLRAYAQHPLFRSVSLDRSYYRMPDVDVLADLASQVPDGFRFVVKAPAVCTSSRLRGDPNPLALDVGWARDHVVGPFTEGLGDKLGLVLLQFPPQPPSALGSFYERLASFLELPLPWAVEVRTPTWLEGPFSAVLQDRGASPCLTIHPSMPDLRTQWRLTRAGDAPNLVIRWNLTHGDYESRKARYAPFTKVVDPAHDLRSGIANAIRWAIERDRPVWVTANNKAEGCAPATLEAIAALV